MRSVVIENKYKNKNIVYIFDILKEIIEPYILEEIHSIYKEMEMKFKGKDCDKIIKNLIYFLYLLFKDQSDIIEPYPNTDNGRPKDGFEFYDKDTGEPLGVYHAHISDINNGVLIWYFELNEYNVPEWRFIFEEHPTDGYKKVLKEIYNSPNTIDIVTFEFLHDKKYLIRESLVKTFLKFLKDNSMKEDMENINEEFKDGGDNRRSISHEKIKERFPNYRENRIPPTEKTLKEMEKIIKRLSDYEKNTKDEKK